MNNYGYIYFLRFVDSGGQAYYKIGITRNDIIGRINSIQTSIPFKISVVKHVFVQNFRLKEKDLHNKYIKYKVLNEWFCFSSDELIFLSDISQLQGDINGNFS